MRAAADPRLRRRETWDPPQGTTASPNISATEACPSFRTCFGCWIRVFFWAMWFETARNVFSYLTKSVLFTDDVWNGDRIRPVRNVMHNRSHKLKFILGTTWCWKMAIGMWGERQWGREMLETCPTAELLQSHSLRYLVYILWRHYTVLTGTCVEQP
jgi:hypothetical protein